MNAQIPGKIMSLEEHHDRLARAARDAIGRLDRAGRVSAGVIDELRDLLATPHANAEAADENDCRAAWRTFVKSALSAEGRKAHQWVKCPQPWIPVQVVLDCVHRVAPQAQLQAELVRCKAI